MVSTVTGSTNVNNVAATTYDLIYNAVKMLAQFSSTQEDLIQLQPGRIKLYNIWWI